MNKYNNLTPGSVRLNPASSLTQGLVMYHAYATDRTHRTSSNYRFKNHAIGPPGYGVGFTTAETYTLNSTCGWGIKLGDALGDYAESLLLTNPTQTSLIPNGTVSHLLVVNHSDSVDSYNHYLSHGDVQVYLVYTTDRWLVKIGNAATWAPQFTSTTSFSSGDILHVFVTWDSEAGTSRMFVNGEEQAQYSAGTASTVEIFDIKPGLGISSAYANYGPYFSTGLWNRQLSDGEIQSLTVDPFQMLTENTLVNRIASLLGGEYKEEASVTLTLSSEITNIGAFNKAISSTLDLNDSSAKLAALSLPISEDLTLLPAVVAPVGRVLGISESLGTSDSGLQGYMYNVYSTVDLESTIKLGHYKPVGDSLTLVDISQLGITIDIASTLTISSAIDKVLGKTIAETLTLASSLEYISTGDVYIYISQTLTMSSVATRLANCIQSPAGTLTMSSGSPTCACGRIKAIAQGLLVDAGVNTHTACYQVVSGTLNIDDSVTKLAALSWNPIVTLTTSATPTFTCGRIATVSTALTLSSSVTRPVGRVKVVTATLSISAALPDQPKQMYIWRINRILGNEIP